VNNHPNSPPTGWTPNVDPRQQVIPPPIGSRVNVIPDSLAHPAMSWTVSTVTDNRMIPPPVGSTPVNSLGQTIQPPMGSEPVNSLGRDYQPPMGSAVHPAACPAPGQTNPSSYNLSSTATQFNEHHQSLSPPIGSAPANLLAGCVIAPPIGSTPSNLLSGQGIQPPIGAAVNPPASGGSYGGYSHQPNPTVSTFDESRFRNGNPMIPPPIGSSPANQLSGQAIPPATTWIMPPPGR
jgi:hypothetical protein